MSADAKPSAQGSPDFEHIDSYVTAQLQEARVPGAAIGIVQAKRVVHLRGFGVAGPAGQDLKVIVNACGVFGGSCLESCLKVPCPVDDPGEPVGHDSEEGADCRQQEYRSHCQLDGVGDAADVTEFTHECLLRP